MKNYLLTAISCLSLAIAAAPAAAQEGNDDAPIFVTEEEEELANFEQEMTDAFAIFGELFAAAPLTPEQQARLPLATEMTAKVFPEGTFAIVMQESMQPMMMGIMGAVTGDPRTELAKLTGVPSDDLEVLEDETAQSALDVLDPQYSARADQMVGLLTGMIGQMFSAMEPAYREALARAFATRFTDAEMTELLAFFETPVGGKFAVESFRVQYDPQMVSVMEEMGPAMVQVMPSIMEGFAAMEAEFPAARVFSDLSEAERLRLSELLGKSTAELEALAPQADTEDADGVGEGVT
ncbi:DUF2059 domain-containing protein [Erythrobacter ani]|uniref:DUF2059 domain-containing protein n=1 Tax=Erythrobacter ani TaxID=2827235 RepID=A0ABS6SM80_9SPHN|nr:DUF2059 domain-containing protein [Erythrobacter ani]MBV7265749.1 DUF2059 domain-containing protein [Erythrobacter ani]